MLKLCFEVTLLSVGLLFCLFRQCYVPSFRYVLPFLLFLHSTYTYFLSLSGPIYNIGYIYIYGFNCLIDIMYISFISFCFCLLPRAFSSIVRNSPMSGSNPHISEARDLRAVSCLSFFVCSPGCKKVYKLRAVQRVRTTNVIRRCLSVRRLVCWIAVCQFVPFTCPHMLVGDPLIH